ncbi:MAG: DUF6456 domain-containing protein [Tepidamorphaceae bacterium]
MTGAIRDKTANARNLIAGLAENDIGIARRNGAWMVIPAASGNSEGHGAEKGLVEELISLGFLTEQAGRALPSDRGLRFAGRDRRSGSHAPAKAEACKPPPRSNAAVAPESPLEWLRRRKGADGRSLIGRAAFEAGEKLRSEYTRAGLMPRMGADLTGNVPGKGRRAGARGPAMMMDAALDARDRVNKALEAVGSEMSGLLVDVCCHLKSLGDVERERGWPKRSAKVVLEMGLARLARHYGMVEEARGRARRGTIERWGSEDYRPGIE